MVWCAFREEEYDLEWYSGLCSWRGTEVDEGVGRSPFLKLQTAVVTQGGEVAFEQGKEEVS